MFKVFILSSLFFLSLLNAELKKSYYSNGTLKSEMNYNDKGEKVGEYKVYYYDGSGIKESGSYDEISKNHGCIKYYRKSGVVGQIRCYKHGLKDGYWSDFNPDKSLYRKTLFKDGKIIGHQVYYKDGGLAEGEYKLYEKKLLKRVDTFKKGLRNGVKRLYFVNQRKKTSVLWREQFYKDGFIHGSKKDWINGFLERSQNFKKGKPDGLFISYFRGSQNVRDSVTYALGLKEGWEIHYHKNGSLKSKVLYKNNKIQNMEKVFYDNRNLASISYYKDGVKEGLYKTFHYNGKISSLAHYKNGFIVGKQSFFKNNGHLDYSMDYKNKMQFYTKTTYFDSQNTKDPIPYEIESFMKKACHQTDDVELMMCTFKKPLSVGDYKRFYDDGKIAFKSHYIDGKLDGPKVSYDKEGKQTSFTRYKAGKLMQGK